MVPKATLQTTCHFVLATPHIPGAIAIVQLIGDHLPILVDLTGICDWPIGRTRLVSFADIDAGLAVRLTDEVAQLMPHGGPRIVQRLIERLVVLGATPLQSHRVRNGEDDSPKPSETLLLHPEASDRVESLMLSALTHAASPLAIDLLLDQPRRWRSTTANMLSVDDIARSQRLNRLIDPPIVVLAGPANVGKSTLSNALLGRAMSITLDQPGTTRDYVAGRIELAGLVVDWYDTPGLRETHDPIERSAIDLARSLMMQADLLISMTAPGESSPQLPRSPDLRVMNKCDLDNAAANAVAATSRPQARSARDDEPLRISATRGDNLTTLVEMVRDRLVPVGDREHPGAWVFDRRLLSA